MVLILMLFFVPALQFAGQDQARSFSEATSVGLEVDTLDSGDVVAAVDSACCHDETDAKSQHSSCQADCKVFLVSISSIQTASQQDHRAAHHIWSFIDHSLPHLRPPIGSYFA